MDEIFITSPVGRLVQGDVHKGKTTDDKGQPLVVKSGPNAGQPRTDYFFTLAIPKAGEQSWQQTPWGQEIAAFAHSAWPQGQHSFPDFSWKIDDGDSTIPNKVGRVNANTDGFPGNWIVRFSGGFAPQLVNKDGTEKIMQDGAIKRGYYIQVYFGVKSNQNTKSPGLYVSPKIVALNAYGEEIKGVELDATSVGFGQSAAPVGAMAVPPAALGAVAAPVPPAAPVPSAPPVAAPVAAPPPNPAILQPPAAPPAKQLTDKAGGATYEQLIAAGWTDELLIANGYMAA